MSCLITLITLEYIKKYIFQFKKYLFLNVNLQSFLRPNFNPVVVISSWHLNNIFNLRALYLWFVSYFDDLTKFCQVGYHRRSIYIEKKKIRYSWDNWMKKYMISVILWFMILATKKKLWDKSKQPFHLFNNTDVEF